VSHARSNALRIVCGGLKTIGREDQDAIICAVVAASLWADVTEMLERLDRFLHKPLPQRRGPPREARTISTSKNRGEG